MEAALKLTPEEKAQVQEIQAARGKLHEEMQAKILPLLTPEQKAKLAEKKPEKDSVFFFPKQIQLNASQQAQLEALKKEYTPQLSGLHTRLTKILTPEREKAAAEAAKAAREAGKSKKEIGEAVQAAQKLTSEEKTQLKEISVARNNLLKEIQTKKLALLTEEQKALVQPKKDKK